MEIKFAKLTTKKQLHKELLGKIMTEISLFPSKHLKKKKKKVSCFKTTEEITYPL